MTLALSDMSDDALRSEIRIANRKKNHFRVAAIKRELVRRREAKRVPEHAPATVPADKPWWVED